MAIKKIDIEKIVPNDENPRYISEDSFQKLVKSLEEFPDMLEKRPLIIDENNVVLGGNMRLRALKEIGLKKIPIIIAEGWTEEQKKEFIIKDNLGFGQWDWDLLANEWDSDKLISWGMDVPSFMGGDNDLGSFFDTPEDSGEDLDSQLNKIVLEYPEEECIEIKEKLLSLGGTPEEAVKLLIENYER